MISQDIEIDRFARDVERLIRRALDGEGPTDGGRFALAVSGGPDSMAMLALAAAAFPRRVAAATFDHQLRAASADEARMVAAACATLGVPHAVLTPVAPIAGASLQAQAREARYAALLDWAAREDCGFLLTAHHADDQAETLLMRLNRASGLPGLSAIRPFRFSGATVILRPLLAWRRAELHAIVVASGLPFVDDSSNHDPRHDRTHIRALLASNHALNPVALAAAAAFLDEADDVIRHQVAITWEERWRDPHRPFVLAGLPREVQRRLLRRAVAEARRALGIVLPPFGDGANVEAVLDAIAAGRNSTIAGLMLVAQDDGWVFRAAPPRRSH